MYNHNALIWATEKYFGNLNMARVVHKLPAGVHLNCKILKYFVGNIIDKIFVTCACQPTGDNL